MNARLMASYFPRASGTSAPPRSRTDVRPMRTTAFRLTRYDRCVRKKSALSRPAKAEMLSRMR